MRYFFLSLVFLHFSASADQKLCSNPDVIVVDGTFILSSNEQTLVCGTRDSTAAWRKVPLEQAQYQLNVLLQSEGYHNATFENDGLSLKVFKGAITRTEKLVLTGTNGVVDAKQKRRILNQPMTPKKLDEVKEWAELSARRQGHACPDIQMRAEVWSRTMFGRIEPGPVQVIGEINRSGYGSLNPNALRRFEAFETGDVYDVVDTQITVDRMMSQGLFQNAYITTTCRGGKVDLDFLTEVGKPKLLRFGLGASTEEFPFVDLWYKNSRLDSLASSFLTQLHASSLRQSFELKSEFYIVPGSYRAFVGPRSKIERQKEPVYESNKLEVGVDLGRAWDVWSTRLNGRIGPTLNNLRTITGTAPAESRYLSWEAALSFMNHSYEAFSRNQAEGWAGDMKYSTQIKNVGAPINVDRFELRFKNFYNVGGYSPPLFVIANRFEVITLNTRGDETQEIADVPVDWRIFYGGNDNVRGFSRQALNNQGQGFMTAALLGSELRIVQVLPHAIEPLLLFDVAKLGTRKFNFIAPTFISFGAGVRWASAVGTLRLSIARGEIVNDSIETSGYPRDWNYNFSFGQEF